MVEKDRTGKVEEVEGRRTRGEVELEERREGGKEGRRSARILALLPYELSLSKGYRKQMYVCKKRERDRLLTSC